MIAVVAHGLEDLPQALVIANVVADEVRGAHGSPPTKYFTASQFSKDYFHGTRSFFETYAGPHGAASSNRRVKRDALDYRA
jgi:hypothetical protein